MESEKTAVTRKLFGKYILADKNIRATIEELLDAVFSTYAVLAKTKPQFVEKGKWVFISSRKFLLMKFKATDYFSRKSTFWC
jgi:hypothetical protein